MYGTGTRSHLKSTEYRSLKQERAEATRQWEQAPRKTVYWPMSCTCREFDYPHLHVSGRGKKYFTEAVEGSVG